ncbi:hypothetical protein IFR05_008808 [Cadophora sp. M221]|nr:hypothetical protein IFR05_008808 [Cadophora sp. M221]
MHKSRLQMGKLLDEIKKKKPENEARRIKNARYARNLRVFNESSNNFAAENPIL